MGWSNAPNPNPHFHTHTLPWLADLSIPKLHYIQSTLTPRRYLISNDIMLTVSKFNKCETCLQKITNPLTIERHVLVGSYFCTHISCLLDFYTDDAVYLTQNTFSNTWREQFNHHLISVLARRLLVEQIVQSKNLG